MLRREVERHAVARVPQEGFPCGHGPEDARLPLEAKIIGDATMAGHDPDHRFRDMDVQVVGDDFPFRVRRSPAELGVQEGGKVGLGARVADHTRDPSAHDVETTQQRLRAMADIFDFPAFDFPGLQRQARGDPLQRLGSAHLVDRHGRRPSRRAGRRLVIDRANLLALLLKVLVRFRRQPTPGLMRFQVGFF